MMLTLRPAEPLGVYCRALGVSLTELSLRTGIARQRLSEIVNGRRSPAVWQREAIAAVLDMPEADLFG